MAVLQVWRGGGLILRIKYARVKAGLALGGLAGWDLAQAVHCEDSLNGVLGKLKLS